MNAFLLFLFCFAGFFAPLIADAYGWPKAYGFALFSAGFLVGVSGGMLI